MSRVCGWYRIVGQPKKLKYCLESFLYLTWAKFQIRCLPYEAWRFRACYAQCESLRHSVAAAEADAIQAIGWAVKRVGKALPWNSKCLDQAMAVQYMLYRRGLDSTLYLGMRKDEQQNWGAHAWVRSGNLWVIGYQVHVNYTTVATYARMARSSA